MSSACFEANTGTRSEVAGMCHCWTFGGVGQQLSWLHTYSFWVFVVLRPCQLQGHSAPSWRDTHFCSLHTQGWGVRTWD